MKKLSRHFILALSLFFLAGCQVTTLSSKSRQTAPHLTSFSLPIATLEVDLGETKENIVPSIEPIEYNTPYYWTAFSSDVTIARSPQKGQILGLKAGKTTFTYEATIPNGEGLKPSATLDVTIKEKISGSQSIAEALQTTSENAGAIVTISGVLESLNQETGVAFLADPVTQTSIPIAHSSESDLFYYNTLTKKPAFQSSDTHVGSISHYSNGDEVSLIAQILVDAAGAPYLEGYFNEKRANTVLTTITTNVPDNVIFSKSAGLTWGEEIIATVTPPSGKAVTSFMIEHGGYYENYSSLTSGNVYTIAIRSINKLVIVFGEPALKVRARYYFPTSHDNLSDPYTGETLFADIQAHPPMGEQVINGAYCSQTYPGTKGLLLYGLQSQTNPYFSLSLKDNATLKIEISAYRYSAGDTTIGSLNDSTSVAPTSFYAETVASYSDKNGIMDVKVSVPAGGAMTIASLILYSY